MLVQNRKNNLQNRRGGQRDETNDFGLKSRNVFHRNPPGPSIAGSKAAEPSSVTTVRGARRSPERLEDVGMTLFLVARLADNVLEILEKIHQGKFLMQTKCLTFLVLLSLTSLMLLGCGSNPAGLANARAVCDDAFVRDGFEASTDVQWDTLVIQGEIARDDGVSKAQALANSVETCFVAATIEPASLVACNQCVAAMIDAIWP